MNQHYRYTLEKGSKKHHCPSCEKKRFVRYVDIKDGKYIPLCYGRCDREITCGYHLSPYHDNYSTGDGKPLVSTKSTSSAGQGEQHKRLGNIHKQSFIPVGVLKQTCDGYDKNIFIQALISNVPFPFDVQDIETVIGMYHLGTIQRGYRTGATTFPFIDIQERIRAIQVKQFDENNHTIGTDFLHSIIEKFHMRSNKPLPSWLEAYKLNETKVSCLFGEHLLTKFPYNPVALVEAPKTAIYGTLYFGCPHQPKNLLWLAVYNLSSLNFSKCRALEGRKVFLFPDLSKGGKAHQLWSEKSAAIQKRLPGTYFQVSDLLERYAPDLDRTHGKDIADYLINQDWRKFRKSPIIEEPKRKSSQSETSRSEKSEKGDCPQLLSFPPPPTKRNGVATPKTEGTPNGHSENWTPTITDLQKFFGETALPTQAIKLGHGTTITDCPLFISNHLCAVRANNGSQAYLPYLERLQMLQQVLKENSIQHEPTKSN